LNLSKTIQNFHLELWIFVAGVHLLILFNISFARKGSVPTSPAVTPKPKPKAPATRTSQNSRQAGAVNLKDLPDPPDIRSRKKKTVSIVSTPTRSTIIPASTSITTPIRPREMSDNPTGGSAGGTTNAPNTTNNGGGGNNDQQQQQQQPDEGRTQVVRYVQMPMSSSRDAPKFSSQNATEIRRFISKMENLFDSAGITDARVKKDKIIDYVDSDAEYEWKGFDSFTTGTWADFVKEVCASYPEAYTENGSLAALESLCREYVGLTVSDRLSIATLIRKFRAEAKRLLDAKVVTNAVVVDKFLGCMSLPLQQFIRDRLLAKYGHYEDRGRHMNDEYDLSEVLAVIHQITTGKPSRDPGELYQRTPVMPKVEDTASDEKFAQLQDGLNVLTKQFNVMQSYMQNIQNDVKNVHQLASVNNQRSGSTFNVNRNNNNSPGNFGNSEGCYYCRQQGHIAVACPEMKRQVSEGKIIMVDGRPRLPDGKYIPREPTHLSVKERVNQLFEKKAASAYYGWPDEGEYEDTKVYSTYTNAVRDRRDDILETISHNRVDSGAEWNQRMNRMEENMGRLLETVDVLVNTRRLADPEEVRRHNSKEDF
jgi:hypothetical protein